MQVACDVVHRHNYIIVAYIFETKAVSQAADARQGRASRQIYPTLILANKQVPARVVVTLIEWNLLILLYKC